jgi:hypothetical protein
MIKKVERSRRRTAALAGDAEVRLEALGISEELINVPVTIETGLGVKVNHPLLGDKGTAEPVVGEDFAQHLMGRIAAVGVAERGR